MERCEAQDDTQFYTEALRQLGFTREDAANDSRVLSQVLLAAQMLKEAARGIPSSEKV